MVFSSPVFLFFFLPLCIITYIAISFLKNIRALNICLLVFSIIFYAYGSFDFLPILFASIIINYYLSCLYSNTSDINIRKKYFIVAIAFNILLLFIYKYLNLFSRVILGDGNGTSIKLPIGISFYTFQVLSYHIDVYRNTVKKSENLIDFALFTMLFPQLIAGPIVRYISISDRLKERTVTLKKFSHGILRFMVGFAKKILLANMLGRVADLSFEGMHTYTLGFFLSLFAIICYAIQIYLDFSAYSDMAIGIGKIFGFDFPENFNMPFLSKSLTEFWRRWHITLSSFFSDYVYKPLGGSKKGIHRTCINIAIVFALSGFWHGANFNFLLWGLYNAFFLIAERLIVTKTKFKFENPLFIIYTCLVWVVGMVIFRFENFNDFLIYINGLFSAPVFDASTRQLLQLIFTPYFVLIFIISILYLTPFFDKIYNALSKRYFGFIVIDLVVVTSFAYAVVEMLTTGFNPFIYFRF